MGTVTRDSTEVASGGVGRESVSVRWGASNSECRFGMRA